MNTRTHPTPASSRVWLLARQEDLRQQIDAAQAAQQSSAAAGGAEVTDLKDQAERSQRMALQNTEMQRDIDELAALQHALARLDDGSYGICTDCTQPIGAERLAAAPAAMRCLGCQTRFEAQQERLGVGPRP